MIVIMHHYKSLAGKEYWYGVIANDGRSVVLCGRNVRVFDCSKEMFTQTLFHSNNAIVALSHDQNSVCAVSTSSNGIGVLAESVQRNGVFIESVRIPIRGNNLDGGKPYYSSENKYIFFCTDSKKIWRYERDTTVCECIYQVSQPDQRLSLDVFEDQLLITLNSSKEVHQNGFDFVNVNGILMKSLRYNDKGVLSKIIRGKWINMHKIIAVYPSALNAPYDMMQKIDWNALDSIDTTRSEPIMEKKHKIFFDICMSPKRNYIVYIYIDLLHKGKYNIRIYRADELMVYETTVDNYTDIEFSDNEKYIFICSDLFLKIDLENAVCK